MPTVVNRHRFQYVRGWGPEPKPSKTGRSRKPKMPEDAIYGGRGTPLGNPFRWQAFGEQALGLYRRHLAIAMGLQAPAVAIEGVTIAARRILERTVPGDPRVLMQLRSIGPETLLVCSCAPQPCHLDIVLNAWLWLRNSNQL